MANAAKQNDPHSKEMSMPNDDTLENDHEALVDEHEVPLEQLINKVQLSDISTHMSGLRQDLDGIEHHMAMQRKVIHRLQQDNIALTSSYCTLQNTLEDSRVEKLLQENTKLQEENRQLRKQVTDLKRQLIPVEPPKAHVCCHICSTCSDFKGADMQLLQRLKEALFRDNIILDTITTTSQNLDILENLLVFCLNVSRLGTDVDLAMQAVPSPCNANTVLVVFRHIAPHASKALVASKERLPASSSGRCSLIVDVRFTAQDGLYSCPDNDVAFQQLSTYICNTWKKRQANFPRP